MKSLKQLVTILRNWLYPQVPVRDVPRINRQAKRLEVENSRRTRVKDCRTMYDEDPRIEGLIDKFASDAVRGGCQMPPLLKTPPKHKK